MLAINAIDIYHHRAAATPRRFESGRPNVCCLYAMAVGSKSLVSIGLENIAQLIAGLTARITGTRLGPVHTLGAGEARYLDGDPLHGCAAARAELKAAGIFVSRRDDNLRVSPHLYYEVGIAVTLKGRLLKAKLGTTAAGIPKFAIPRANSFAHNVSTGNQTL